MEYTVVYRQPSSVFTESLYRKEAERVDMEEKYATLQDEAAAKKTRLKEVWREVQRTREEVCSPIYSTSLPPSYFPLSSLQSFLFYSFSCSKFSSYLTPTSFIFPVCRSQLL